jgi:NADH pyrophosphatase NudC (nudix superfamily)
MPGKILRRRDICGNFHTHEINEVRWFTKEKIWQMLSAGEIKDGYTLTGFLLDQYL